MALTTRTPRALQQQQEAAAAAAAANGTEQKSPTSLSGPLISSIAGSEALDKGYITEDIILKLVAEEVITYTVGKRFTMQQVMGCFAIGPHHPLSQMRLSG